MTFAVSFFLTVLSRVIPHPANFVPVGAFTIFQSRRSGVIKAIIFVILAMLISDLLLGFHFAQPFVYLGMITYALWGLLAKTKWGILLSSIGGSFSFFIISNFGVWLGPWYSHDLAGFVKCFTLAVPFYKNTLLSDVIYTVAIFSAYALYGKIKRGEIQWQRNFLQPISRKK